MPVVTAAISRTASGERRAVNMMSSAPTNGDHVMTDRMGTIMRAGTLSPMRVASFEELDPDEEGEDAEGHAVDVVLGLAALDAPETGARAQRPGREHVEDTVHDVTIDPADEPGEAQHDASIEGAEERI